MAGFFAAAGLLSWAGLFDRKRVAWRSWFCGSCLGALTLIPWIRLAWTEFGGRRANTFSWVRWFEFRFWMYWATEPLGFSLDYSLGPEFAAFLRYPLIGGRPTYLVLLLHVLMGAAGAVILVRAAHQAWQERRRWRDLCVGRQSPTAFTLSAALLGSGILITASSLQIERQYMAATFPLAFVWLAWIALTQAGHPGRTPRHGRTLLLTLCVTQFLLSVNFLGYIHVNHGAIHGDYGVAFRAQQQPLHPPLDY
jgi:hypothetical protein